MASVTLQNVAKRFGSTTIVANLNLAIRDGEFVTLLGPSGCGKSTTLNMIVGLEPCSSGAIYFNDGEVTHHSPSQRDVAMVFQSYALYPHLSVYDNIAFPLVARKVSRADRKVRVESAAERLALTPLLQRLPRQLSGGQRQRVALARAIVRTPRVFLFDEPLSNLDASLKVTTRSEIKKLHQDLGATMVYVTHDQAEAMSLSDRIAIMRGGELQQFDTPHAVYHHPANLFVATFIGSPAMNLWKGRVASAGLLRVGELLFPFSLELPCKEGDALTIGLRPHQWQVSHEARPEALPAQVLTNQPMGECNFLDLQLAGQRAIVRTEAHFVVKPGDLLYLSYDRAQAHCFTEGAAPK